MSDFTVQRGQATIASAAVSAAIAEGVDYTAAASASAGFIRPTSHGAFGGGGQSNDFNGSPRRNLVGITDPGDIATASGDITFQRDEAADPEYVDWEIVEYTGAAGGANEAIVRHTDVITVGSSDLSATANSGVAIPGIVSDSDVVVYITGVQSASNGRAVAEQHGFVASISSGVVTVTRGVATKQQHVSIAVVEFTGSNWSVQRIAHTMTAAATTETETITNVGSVNRAFTHAQQSMVGLNEGPDTAGYKAWVSSTTQASFYKPALAATSETIVLWVVSNSDAGAGAMSVERVPEDIGTGTRSDNAGGGTDPDTWTETVTAVSALGDSSIMGECATSSNNADTHILQIGARLTDTSTVTLDRGRDEADRTYHFEVVQWPSGGAVDSVVTMPDSTADGETGVAATYTGYASGDINSVTVDGVSATGIVDNLAGSVTFNMPDVTSLTSDAGTTVPNFGVVSFAFSNGTESDSDTATVVPKAGWAVVDVSGVNTTDPNYLYSLIFAATSGTVVVADGWEWYHETADSTAILPDGQITSDGTTFKLIAINRILDDVAYPFQWVNGELTTARRSRITQPVTISVRGTACSRQSY